MVDIRFKGELGPQGERGERGLTGAQGVQGFVKWTLFYSSNLSTQLKIIRPAKFDKICIYRKKDKVSLFMVPMPIVSHTNSTVTTNA